MTVLSLAQARAVADHALAGAGHNDLTSPLAVAVVDAHGELLCYLAGDAAAPLPRRLATRKAYTAALMRRATAIITEEVRQGVVNLASLGDPVLLAMPGGVPILIDGVVVGAVGVSGLPAETDATIAAAAATALP